MSALAKVFVVFIFLLSVTFFGTSATLYLTREDWKTKFDEYKTGVEEQYEKLAKQIDDQKKVLDDQQTNLLRLKGSESTLAQRVKSALDELKTKDGEIAELRADRGKVVAEKTAVQNELAAEKNRSTQLITNLEQAHRTVEDATGKQRDADKRLFAMARDVQQLQSELLASRTEYTELRDKYESLELAYEGCKRGGDPGTLAPPIDALVEDVDPGNNLVVLSVGENDQVKPGFEFTVYRADQFVAKVRVTKVYANLSGARIILPEGASVSKGDRATTRIN